MSTRARSSFDARLADALRPLAANAPMPERVLDVPDAWVRRGPRLSHASEVALVGGVVAAAAGATLFVLAVIGSLGGPPSVGDDSVPSAVVTPDVGVPIENLDTTVRPDGRAPSGPPGNGQGVEVVRGHVDGRPFSYAMTGQGSDTVCITGGIGVDWSAACGALPGEGPSGGVFGVVTTSQGAADVHAVVGMVDVSVSEVWIETTTGARAAAALVDLRPADVEAWLFIVMLPAGVDVTAWGAADADGGVVDRFEVPDVPEPSGGRMPTPAAEP